MSYSPSSTESIKRILQRARVELDRARKQVATEREAHATAQQKVEHATQAQQFLQELAQTVQQQAHQQIARVVSRCLSAVFDAQYELLINFEKMRGKTEAMLSYWKDGHEIDPEVDSGGVRQVAELACRLASLTLSLPQAAKVLILDEPFGEVDAENTPKIALLLKTLSRELGVQFILSTHSSLLAECLGEFGAVVQL